MKKITRHFSSAAFTAGGAEASPPNSPAEFRDRFSREIKMWEKFIKTSGIKFDPL